MEQKTKKQATADGDKTYFNGKPCPHGHLGPRWTRSGVCTECTRLGSKAWAAKQPKEKFCAYTKKYREANREEVQRKDRELKRQLRQTEEGKKKAQEANRASYAKAAAEEGRVVQPRWKKTDEADIFVRASAVHQGLYLYVAGSYQGMHKQMRIVCPTHGEYTQTPQNHLKGAGCNMCSIQKSAPEEAVAAFISIFTPVIRRDRVLLRPKELDIVIPEKKLAIEYCGEYYHSSGDAESDPIMSTKHLSKHKACAAQGIRLITIFDTEWQTRNYAIRRLLRNAVGKARGKVMARKCELRSVDLPAARAFYERYHPQGGAGAGEHYGLYYKDKLVACMRFTHGANDRGKSRQRVWTLSRYATRVTVAGGASRLFKAFVDEHRPTQVKSFSDNRYFGGGMYVALGFTEEDESGADYQVWHPRLGLTPKPQWQRRNIPAVAKQLKLEVEFDPDTDPRTERDMTYLLGGRRIYDCGKKRWVWNSLTPAKNPATLPAP